ncbi:MAG TPA: hypothetical protein VNE39_14280 [Planctomycetota bacterium]|nr:hypothetical protein [Planctomycetota bacterium]
MASEGLHCQGCGKPLEGRDRFEGKCPACREAEILGRALPAEAPGVPEQAAGAGGGAPPAARFPAPARLALLGGAVLLGAVVGALLLWPRKGVEGPPAQNRVVPPEPGAAPGPREPAPGPAPPARKAVSRDLRAALQQETLELLRLLARGSHERVIDNYVQADEVDFGRAERALDDIVQGSAAKGFAEWAARLIRLREARVAEDLRRAGDADPGFTAALLGYLAREPAASDAGLRAEDRARNVLRWHLASLFDGLDVGAAEVRDMAETAPGCFEVALDCRGERRAAWLRAEPTRLCWCKLPVGWVVKVGLADRLERVRDVLKRPLAAERPAAP